MGAGERILGLFRVIGFAWITLLAAARLILTRP